MSQSARSLQYLGTDIGESSHLPDTTEPYTNHNTTYNDNNNNTTIATTTRTTALTCVFGDDDTDDDAGKDIYNAPDYAI